MLNLFYVLCITNRLTSTDKHRLILFMELPFDSKTCTWEGKGEATILVARRETTEQEDTTTNAMDLVYTIDDYSSYKMNLSANTTLAPIDTKNEYKEISLTVRPRKRQRTASFFLDTPNLRPLAAHNVLVHRDVHTNTIFESLLDLLKYICTGMVYTTPTYMKETKNVALWNHGAIYDSRRLAIIHFESAFNCHTRTPRKRRAPSPSLYYLLRMFCEQSTYEDVKSLSTESMTNSLLMRLVITDLRRNYHIGMYQYCNDVCILLNFVLEATTQRATHMSCNSRLRKLFMMWTGQVKSGCHIFALFSSQERLHEQFARANQSAVRNNNNPIVVERDDIREYVKMLNLAVATPSEYNTKSWVPASVLVELATGARISEILRHSQFMSYDDLGDDNATILASFREKRQFLNDIDVSGYLYQKGSLKKKTDGDKLMAPRPIMFGETIDSVKRLIYNVIRPQLLAEFKQRANAWNDGGGVDGNVEKVDFNNKTLCVNRFIKRTYIGHTNTTNTRVSTTHDFRRIYANWSFDNTVLVHPVTRNTWITHLLGHDENQLVQSLSYTGVVFQDTKKDIVQ